MSKDEEVSKLNRSKSMNRVEEKFLGAAGEQAGNGRKNIKENEEKKKEKDRKRFLFDVSKEMESL